MKMLEIFSRKWYWSTYHLGMTSFVFLLLTLNIKKIIKIKDCNIKPTKVGLYFTKSVKKTSFIYVLFTYLSNLKRQ